MRLTPPRTNQGTSRRTVMGLVAGLSTLTLVLGGCSQDPIEAVDEPTASALAEESASPSEPIPADDDDQTPAPEEAPAAEPTPCDAAIFEKGGPAREPADLRAAVSRTVDKINEIGGVQVMWGEGMITTIYSPTVEPYFVDIIIDEVAGEFYMPSSSTGFQNHMELGGLVESMENSKEYDPEYAGEFDNIGAVNGFAFEIKQATEPPSTFSRNVIMNDEGLIVAVCEKNAVVDWAYEYGISDERLAVLEEVASQDWDVEYDTLPDTP